MKITTIIPVHNVTEYLAEALESVFAQGAGDVQTIVVDDGSSPEHGCVIRDICAKYSSVELIVQPNQGPAKARDTGLARAEGELVVFLDGDDKLFAGAFEYFRKGFSRYPDAEAVYGLVEWFGEGSEFAGEVAPQPSWRVSGRKLFENMLERKPAFCIGSYCCRKDVLQSLPTGGYQLTLSYEWWQWCHLALSGRIYYGGDRVVLGRRRHSRRISEMGFEDPQLIFKACAAIFGEQLFEEAIGRDRFVEMRKRCENRINAYLASSFAAKKMPEEARHFFLKLNGPIKKEADN